MFVESILSKTMKRLRTVGPKSGVYPYITFISLITCPFDRLWMPLVTFTKPKLYQILLLTLIRCCFTPSIVVEAFVNERGSSLRFRQKKVRHLCALFGQHMCTFVG